MKTLMTFILLVSSSLFAATFNEHVLGAIKVMPVEGRYVLSGVSPRAMNAGFSWDPSNSILYLDPSIATPTYCTTATYMAFFLALKSFHQDSDREMAPEVYAFLKPKLEDDGVGSWGRWNSNGPGTAKFLHDLGMARNFENIEEALPGDFLKVWWNEHVGKLEKGHSVIYLGRETIDGVEHLRFWSSNSSTNGLGDKLIPSTLAIRTLFTRVERPLNITNVTTLPLMDNFLASMLERESNWEEVKSATGVE